jgi:hypothetical protein
MRMYPQNLLVCHKIKSLPLAAVSWFCGLWLQFLQLVPACGALGLFVKRASCLEVSLLMSPSSSLALPSSVS